MPVLTKINTNVIADDAVTAAKIPADALGATDIAANAIGTSEIATGGVLPANIAYLGDGTGNLSGTITNQQLHFGSAFTLTDDLTVNGDVTLGKVRDDGTGQSITGDGKTLTGTGTLTMGSSIEGEPKNRTSERATTLGDITTGNVTVSGDFIPSTPLSHRNMIINGDMSINQRGNLANTSAVGYNALDRWKWAYHTGLGTVDHTTGTKDEHGAGPVGFAYSYRIAIDSNSGTGTGTYAHLEQRIEGNNCKRLLTNVSAGVGLNSFTLSFYVKTPTTGIYSVAISQPQNSNRIYTTSYTVTDTNWNRYEITIPADTAGVVNLDTSTGLIISFTVGGISSSGSTVGGAGVASWGAYAATKRSMSGQANLFAGTIGDAFYITGVQLELGSSATPFEHRSYGEELARCRRYLWRIDGGSGKYTRVGLAYGVSSTLLRLPVYHQWRETPTVEYTGTFAIQGGGTLASTPFTVSTNSSNNGTALVEVTLSSGGVLGTSVSIHSSNQVGQYFQLVSEL